MNKKELYDELEKLGLRIVWGMDLKRASIGNPDFANPIIWFDAYLEADKYMGTINIKAINATLFTERQIKESLRLVNEFLMTPLKERGL